MLDRTMVSKGLTMYNPRSAGVSSIVESGIGEEGKHEHAGSVLWQLRLR